MTKATIAAYYDAFNKGDLTAMLDTLREFPGSLSRLPHHPKSSHAITKYPIVPILRAYRVRIPAQQQGYRHRYQHQRPTTQKYGNK